MDAEGIIPSDLPRAIASFRTEHGQNARVNVLYVVPTAQNPTGALMGVERRREVLRVSIELDLIIVEDDPYNALELAPYSSPGSRHNAYKGSKGLLPTLFSMDTHGRVIYLYTFSKVITPGMRIGFVAASEELIHILKYFQEVGVIYLLHLFNEWGPDGFDAHVRMLQEHYSIRRDWIIDASNKYLYPLEGYSAPVDYEIPESGMFVWYKLNLNSSHSVDTPGKIHERLIERSVLLALGDMFNPDLKEAGTTPFFRVAFSFQTKENIETALRTLGEVLREFRLGNPTQ
ncbi:hypothetical protein HDU97_000555 [Phlyctochytrium planicorne]|nr:hypothetical protein HDU97_000555 [Phlyctochytrium planicorne]